MMRKASANLWKSKQRVTNSLKLALSFAVVKDVIGLCLKPRISRIICYFHDLISKAVRGERASDHLSLMCPLGVPGAVFVAFRFLINATLLRMFITMIWSLTCPLQSRFGSLKFLDMHLCSWPSHAKHRDLCLFLQLRAGLLGGKCD